ASRLRRRVLGASYSREVQSLAAMSPSVFERAASPGEQSDAKLDATLSVVRDEMAWSWSAAAVGKLLDGEELEGWDALLPLLPAGTPVSAEAPSATLSVPAGSHAAARGAAERTAIALGHALAAAVQERARRLVDAGVLSDAGDVAHLRWDELLAPPDDA